MTAPFGKVDRARRQRLGMEGQPQDVEGLARAAVAERPRAAAPPCGWRSPDSSAGHRPAPDWVHAPSAPGRSRRAPISARDRRGRAAERPARSLPPPASTLRSRKGTSRRSASLKTISRDGAARPVSTKLRWRADISASPARSSWLRWRRCRHSRKWSPIWTGWDRSARAVEACAFMLETYHANFAASITSEVIELGSGPGHLRHHRR